MVTTQRHTQAFVNFSSLPYHRSSLVIQKQEQLRDTPTKVGFKHQFNFIAQIGLHIKVIQENA